MIIKNSIFTLLSIILLINFISCDKEPEENNNNNNNTTSEVLSGGNFDSWITIIQGEVSFEEPEGNWWGSLNTLSFIGGPITITKTEDSYSGDYAVRLETLNWGDNFSIPGILASGYFDRNLPMGENLVVGKEFENRPDSFSGYYKYFPANNDSLVIFIALTKYDSVNKKRDTIAQSEFVHGETISVYTPFEILVNYNSTENPDSIHVILLASIRGKEMQGHHGSVLYIDELQLNYR